jgi:hypothetical protein
MTALHRKRRSPRTPIARGFKLPSDVTVRSIKRGDLRDIEVDIGPDRIARLARAERVPDEALDILAGRLKSLVADLVEFGDEMRVQRTRRQLRQELIDLLRALKTGKGLPVIPPSLRSEIEGYLIRCRLDLPFGQAPTVPLHEVDVWCRRQSEARAEGRAAFADPTKLIGVIEDVLRFLTRSDPYTREYFATKSAFRYEVEIVCEWIGGFWRFDLHRELINSDELRDFAIEVLKTTGVSIPALSLERRLQAMARSAARAD